MVKATAARPQGALRTARTDGSLAHAFYRAGRWSRLYDTVGPSHIQSDHPAPMTRTSVVVGRTRSTRESGRLIGICEVGHWSSNNAKRG